MSASEARPVEDGDVAEPIVDDLPVTEVRAVYQFKPDGERYPLPTRTGGGKWATSFNGAASARAWAMSWTAGGEPAGLTPGGRRQKLTNAWDSKRKGDQTVDVIVILRDAGRRVEYTLTYAAGQFVRGGWKLEEGREPRRTGTLTAEPAVLLQAAPTP